MNARRRSRVILECPIIFAGDWFVGEGRVVNLSLVGCAMETGKTPRTGDYLKGHILLPDEQPLIVSLAKVQWTRRGMFGLEFLNLAPMQQVRLARFLETFIPLPAERPAPHQFEA